MPEITYNMKLVFVVVDALKSIYLTEENMPFLYSLSNNQSYIERVIPSPGFCERSEIFSGLDSFDSGNFTAIGYDPSRSVYKTETIPLLLARSFSTLAPAHARSCFYHYCIQVRKVMRPYLIPFKGLPNFSLTEDGSYDYVKHETLFNILDKNKKSYNLDFFTSLSAPPFIRNMSEIDFLKKQISNNVYFIPIYYGTIDSIGHIYGDDIKSIQPHLKELDEILSTLYLKAREHDYAFAVLGDHGMVPVEKKVNIEEVLNSVHLKRHKDYEYFLDSTVARFWSFSREAGDILREIVNRKLYWSGEIIDMNNYLKYRIPLDIKTSDKALYGDFLWCANPGIIIYPDFFNRILYRGMHGYLLSDTLHGTGLFVSEAPCLRKTQQETASLSSICSEIANILEIDKPNKSWKRVIA